MSLQPYLRLTPEQISQIRTDPGETLRIDTSKIDYQTICDGCGADLPPGTISWNIEGPHPEVQTLSRFTVQIHACETCAQVKTLTYWRTFYLERISRARR